MVEVKSINPFHLYDPNKDDHVALIPKFRQAPATAGWLDWTLPGGYQAADRIQGESAELAATLRERFDNVIASFVEQCKDFGCSKFQSEFIISELLQNATQYGRCSSSAEAPVVVSVEWNISSVNNQPSLMLAVSNPVQSVFNPAKYCNMKDEDFMAAVEQGCNCHVGATTLVGFLKKGEALTYKWFLTSGEAIVCQLREVAGESNEAEDQCLINPVSLSFSKFDSSGALVEYSEDDFKRDVESALPAEAVTVTGKFAPSA